MRGSILYLAIVAIWAGFLVPAWLRRPHASKADSEAEVGAEGQELAYAPVTADGYGTGDAEAGGAAEFGGDARFEGDTRVEGGDARFEGDTRAGRDAYIGAAHFGGAGRPGGEYGQFTAEMTAEYVTDTENDVENGFEADIHVEVTRRPQEYRGEMPEYRSDEAGYDRAPEGQFTDGVTAERAAARLSQSREQMLRARRRMLSILVVLTLITTSFAGLGLVKWWICVPPAAVLVLYVLLLREIAMADAELARKRHAWEARVARQQHEERRREHEAWVAESARAAEAAQPTAEIIDISGRVGDQLYDQYADAASRAVGD